MNPARSQATTAPTMAPPPARRQLQPLVFSEAALSATKWLALVLMVVDHWNHYLFKGSVAWMYALGRISMPLFAFALGYNLARPGMLANGGYRRLALRLTVFGLLATVPFVAMNKLSGGWWPLNMMFTLLVPVVTAWLLDKGGTVPTIVAYLVLIWGGALGEYWWPAVGLCLCLWAYQRQPSRGLIVAYFLCLLLLYFVNWNLWALAAVPLLVLLHRWKLFLPRAQWLFYAFYPTHFALIWFYLSMQR